MDEGTTSPLGGATAISGAVATDEAITLNRLIDAYIMAYTGRYKARHYRVDWWRSRLGDRAVTTITDEDVFQALEAYASAPARVYAGRDADGNRVFRAKGKPSDSTVNRHQAALSAVIKWGLRRRPLPRGFHNPARQVERRPEAQGRGYGSCRTTSARGSWRPAGRPNGFGCTCSY